MPVARGPLPACEWVMDQVDRFYATPWGQHFKNARKEMLLGIRALLDRKIERLDSLGQPREAQKIEVE
jgi:hypothetical protein